MLGDLQRQEEHCRSWVLLGIAAIPEGLSRGLTKKTLGVFVKVFFFKVYIYIYVCVYVFLKGGVEVLSFYLFDFFLGGEWLIFVWGDKC